MLAAREAGRLVDVIDAILIPSPKVGRVRTPPGSRGRRGAPWAAV